MKREAAVTFRDALAGSRAQVEEWARGLPPRAGGPPPIAYIPHMSTPHFDFYVIGQPAMGPAGDLYVMCDGQTVLAGGPAGFSAVLRGEALFDDPAAIAPALAANLFLRIVVGQRIGVIEAPDDFALAKLRPAARATFEPPRARREADALVLTFWTSGPEPFDVRAWQVRAIRDGEVTHSVQTVE